MNDSRKRVRSEDDNFGLQSKYFVSQKLLDLNSDQKMEEVYGKIEF